MVPEKYGLAAIGRFLIEQFELRRPGLKEWTPEVERSLRRDAETELLQMERQLTELGIDDPQYWQRVRGALDDILLPRYARQATEEIALAKRDYGIWRGGDLLARGVFALVAFILGIIAVEIPYIPVYEKWFPALLLIAGPLFPDIVMWWYRRRFRKKLDQLVADLARASNTLETYRPLSELTRSLEMRADLAEAPAGSVERDGAAKERERS
jgi:hypothetical protein